MTDSMHANPEAPGAGPVIDFSTVKADPPPPHILAIRVDIAEAIGGGALALAGVAPGPADLAAIAADLDIAAGRLSRAASNLRRHARKAEEEAAQPAEHEGTEA